MVSLGREIVPQQQRAASIGRDQDVQIAVPIDVGRRHSTSHDGFLKWIARGIGDLLELPAPRVSEQLRALTEGHVGPHRVDLGLDVAVGRQQVRVPVQVEVGEPQPERERQECASRDACRAREVLEQPAPHLRVERDRLVGEVADGDGEPALGRYVGHVDAHAGARAPHLVERDARRDRRVSEGPVAIAQVEEVLVGVVGDEKVGPPVVVEVLHGNTQRLALRIEQPGVLGGIPKAGAPLIAVQAAALAVILLGRGVRLGGAVPSGEDVGLGRPADVVADEQVQKSVPVHVHPGRGGRPGRRGVRTRRVAVDAHRARDVREASSVVPQELVVSHGRHVDVWVPVGVVISERGSHPVDREAGSGRGRNVFERAVATVPVEPRRRGLGAALVARPLPAVDQKQVGPAVLIVVQEAAAAPHGLRHPLLSEGTGHMHEVDAGGYCDVGEGRRDESVRGAPGGKVGPGELGPLGRGRLVSPAARPHERQNGQERSSPAPPAHGRMVRSCVWMGSAMRFTPGFRARNAPVTACAASSMRYRSYAASESVASPSRPSARYESIWW